METPSISVIVPVFNVKPFLRECLDSILSQEGVEFELILVDDGSTDGCAEICDEYGKRDSRINVIHKKNGGLSSARNCGMDSALGEFILFVDSDDYIIPDTLKVLWEAQKENGADVVRARYKNVFDVSVPKSYTGGTEYFLPPENGIATMEDVAGKARIRFMGSACIMLERRALLLRHSLRFREDVIQGEDWPFTVALAEIIDKEGYRYHFVDKELYCYRRQTHNSITATYSSTKLRRAREALARIDFLREYLEKKYPQSRVDEALGNIYVDHYIRYMVVCAADNLITGSNESYQYFCNAFNSIILRRALSYYTPKLGKGRSRLLPWIIRMRLTQVGFWCCRHKAKNRYGREIRELKQRNTCEQTEQEDRK